MTASTSRRPVDLLFTLRARALRLLDPMDRMIQRLRGRSDWPPLSLRRHVGPVGRYEAAARQTREWLQRFELIFPGASVLDIGCGCGAMVPTFRELLGPEGRYLGFDVYPPAIDWCRKQYAGEPNIRFELADIASPYGRSDGRAIEDFRFPAATISLDLILAKSVFTHLTEEAARHYLRETFRTLKPGGRALISAFLFARELAGPELFEALPAPADPEAKIRWRKPTKPEAAIAFDGELFNSWITHEGFQIREFVPIFWPAKRSVFSGQDLLVLEKPRPFV